MLKYFLLLSFCLISSTIQPIRTAYSFDLFNETRGQQKTPPPQKQINKNNPFQQAINKKPVAPKKNTQRAKKPQKDFLLKGVLQIGSKYSVILQTPTNKSLTQRYHQGKEVQLVGFPNYRLLSVAAREIELEYPKDAPCQKDNPQRGIKCKQGKNDKTTAILSLVRNKAVKRAPTPAQTRQNPFTANNLAAQEQEKKRQADLARRKEVYKNFKRKVIKDDEVPEGMRVIRTPFGDRLVPKNK